GNLDGVEIRYGDLFHKKAGVLMGIRGTVEATPASAGVRDMVARFHNAEIRMTGGMEGLGKETAPVVRLALDSNAIPLGPWSELVPMLKAYELSGTGALEAKV